jgi:hypothetical protein
LMEKGSSRHLNADFVTDLRQNPLPNSRQMVRNASV